MRFYLRESKSPTFFNVAKHLKKLGWQNCLMNFRTNFNEQNFQFDKEASQTLEFKHLLNLLVEKYCPHVMPASYRINDSNYHAVLSEIAHLYYGNNSELLDNNDNLVWILKPSLLNNGKNILIFQQFSELRSHFKRSDRLGGEQVLQRYITHPFLLDERKFSIRMFAVLSNYGGTYIYPQGYLNISLHRYRSSDFDDYRCHLTNEHLQDEPNVVQVPSQKIKIFKHFYLPIKERISTVVQALREQHPQAFMCDNDKKKTLGIFGFDFMLDLHYRPWLLEVNHGPWFPNDENHPLYKHFYQEFWEAFIENFVLPIAAKRKMFDFQHNIFEPC